MDNCAQGYLIFNKELSLLEVVEENSLEFRF